MAARAALAVEPPARSKRHDNFEIAYPDPENPGCIQLVAKHHRQEQAGKTVAATWFEFDAGVVSTQDQSQQAHAQFKFIFERITGLANG